MLEQPQYPIDDNTLFILLALRYQGKIKIVSWDSIYDGNVRYNETAIKPNKDYILDYKTIADIGINWICKTFNVKAKQDKNNVLHLTRDNSEILKNFLDDDYLAEFKHYKNYASEKEHKKNFYRFIKKRCPYILDFGDKYFTYKLYPEEDTQKYKMIEYIGFLIQQNILLANEETFVISDEISKTDKTKIDYKKAINLKFCDEETMVKFFKKYLEEDKQDILLNQVINKQPTDISTQFKLYANSKLNVEYDGNRIHLKPALFKLLEFCVKNKKKTITIKEYLDYINNQLRDSSIEKYFTELNRALNAKVISKPKEGIRKVNI